MQDHAVQKPLDIISAPEIDSVLDYALRVTDNYRSRKNVLIRKAKGQVFTPIEVAEYMASLITFDSHEFKILDPGAGTGILTAAVCEQVLKSKREHVSLYVDLYENDPDILPFLNEVLQRCKTALEENGHEFACNIIEKDFIISNYMLFNDDNTPNLFQQKRITYDVVISNPPYFKLNKNSQVSLAMKDIVYGQPNIYSFFMALSIALLKRQGQLVSITPRSFCSGLYFKKFRKWFLSETRILSIHNFISRKLIFKDDDVLQENVILKATKTECVGDHTIHVSMSHDHSFHDLQSCKVEKNRILFRKNGDLIIRIPSAKTDLDVLRIVDSWPHILKDFGIEISTGPVVSFRAKEHIRNCFDAKKDAPLLWMQNIQGWQTKWPVEKNGKETAIHICAKSKKLLLPVKNYILLKRFTAKEQKRRLYASVMLKSDFKQFEQIGIENHINYIHKFKDSLSGKEVFGIAGILNTQLLDNYFRSLNGNTQVNAIDIRSLPFPSMDKITEIGESIQKNIPAIGIELDMLVAKIMEIDSNIIKNLYMETDSVGKN